MLASLLSKGAANCPRRVSVYEECPVDPYDGELVATIYCNGSYCVFGRVRRLQSLSYLFLSFWGTQYTSAGTYLVAPCPNLEGRCIFAWQEDVLDSTCRFGLDPPPNIHARAANELHAAASILMLGWRRIALLRCQCFRNDEYSTPVLSRKEESWCEKRRRTAKKDKTRSRCDGS